MTKQSNKQWVLQRTDKDGYTQQIVFTGFLSRKPKGWIVIQQLPAPAPAGSVAPHGGVGGNRGFFVPSAPLAAAKGPLTFPAE